MDDKTLAELKRDFRKWSGGFSPESVHQITVYVDYAMNMELASPEETREALLDWIEADDPDEDIYKSGDLRHTEAEFYSLDRVREAQEKFRQEEERSKQAMRKWLDAESLF